LLQLVANSCEVYLTSWGCVLEVTKDGVVVHAMEWVHVEEVLGFWIEGQWLPWFWGCLR